MRCRLSIHRNIRISRMHRGHSPSKKTSTCHFIEGFDILALVRQENEMLVSVMSHHHAIDCRSESILTSHRLGKQLHYQKSIASSRATTNRMWYTSSLVMTARWVFPTTGDEQVLCTRFQTSRLASSRQKEATTTVCNQGTSQETSVLPLAP